MSNIRRFRKTHKKHSKKNASYKQLRIHRQPTTNSSHSQSAHTKIYKGGIGEAQGFPQCTTLSQFQMTDGVLANFGRHFKSPSDCFISALQLFNIVDLRSANLMRISSAGRTGFLKTQIEVIFIYLLGNNFDFKSTYNYDEFAGWIQNLLQPGFGVLAGYEGHVFVIAKGADGTIAYIDPQVPPNGMMCDVRQCENTYLKNKPAPWYLLFNSPEHLSEAQQQQVAEYRP